MIPKDTKWLEYADTGIPGRRQKPAYTCAECVRSGARTIRVFRSASGIAEHLFVAHSVNVVEGRVQR